MTPKQILTEARQLLIDKGWVPNSGSIEGPICALRAIGRVAADDYKDAVDAMIKVIGEPYVFIWNDRQTSITPILAAFDAAIASLE